VASEDKNLYALDATTGQKRWWFSAKTSIFTPPVVANGAVYICSQDGRVYALDAANGNQRWIFPRAEQ
jgi:outer membrane protein assembly factor BamB